MHFGPASHLVAVAVQLPLVLLLAWLAFVGSGLYNRTALAVFYMVLTVPTYVTVGAHLKFGTYMFDAFSTVYSAGALIYLLLMYAVVFKV
jgi:hypothetical protein